MSQLQLLIAQYLVRHYPAVAPVFLDAARVTLPDEPLAIDLETLVEEYLAKEAVNQMATLNVEDYSLGQSMKRDTEARLLRNHRTIDGITTGNLLAVQVVPVPRRRFDTTTAM